MFFADTDSLVTNMYARFFSEDPACSLTTEDYESVIKPAAYRYAGKIEWDRIFCIVPHGAFVDDHVRFMAHSGIEERLRMFEILRESLIDTDNWDKVVVLDGNYYENFTAVAQYVKTLLES